MTVLAVDLAAKYSAACLMDHDYRVIDQFDSDEGRSEDDFVYKLAGFWMFYYDSEFAPEVMVVEDLPHGLKYSSLVKAVCRLQGRIAQAMHETTEGDYEDLLFLAPATWRAHYDLKRGTGPEAVFDACAQFGYEAPDLTERFKGKGGRTKAKKIESDYCAAYLMAHWAIDMHKTHKTYDVPGTSRYNTDVIRKKDFDAKDDSAREEL